MLPVKSPCCWPSLAHIQDADVARGQDCAMSRSCEVVSYCGRYHYQNEICYTCGKAGTVYSPPGGGTFNVGIGGGGTSGNRFPAQCPMQARGVGGGFNFTMQVNNCHLDRLNVCCNTKRVPDKDFDDLFYST